MKSRHRGRYPGSTPAAGETEGVSREARKAGDWEVARKLCPWHRGRRGRKRGPPARDEVDWRMSSDPASVVSPERDSASRATPESPALRANFPSAGPRRPPIVESPWAWILLPDCAPALTRPVSLPNPCGAPSPQGERAFRVANARRRHANDEDHRELHGSRCRAPRAQAQCVAARAPVLRVPEEPRRAPGPMGTAGGTYRQARPRSRDRDVGGRAHLPRIRGAPAAPDARSDPPIEGQGFRYVAPTPAEQLAA